MSTLNQFDIAKTLRSEIVGRSRDCHGQISTPGVVQSHLDLRSKPVAPTELHRNLEVDTDKVIQAFYDVRDDQRSPDLYVADPSRNRRFLDRCRELGEHASEYAINKTLLNARKANLLKNLKSKPTRFVHERYVFASEFAATELRYRTGASIDDIICDPALAAEFDAIAIKIAPGFTPLQYRWAMLSVRKAGKSKEAKWEPKYEMPRLEDPFPLLSRHFPTLPDERGVYLLLEKSRTLYVHGTRDISRGIELHRQVDFRGVFAECLWDPDPDELLVTFATVPEARLMRPVELRLICERKPLFNIVNAAA